MSRSKQLANFLKRQVDEAFHLDVSVDGHKRWRGQDYRQEQKKQSLLMTSDELMKKKADAKNGDRERIIAAINDENEETIAASIPTDSPRGGKADEKATISTHIIENGPIYLTLKVGDDVQAEYKNDGRFYDAKIMRVIHGGYSSAEYDVMFDGFNDVENLSWRKIRFKPTSQQGQCIGRDVDCGRSLKTRYSCIDRNEDEDEDDFGSRDGNIFVDEFGRDISGRKPVISPRPTCGERKSSPPPQETRDNHTRRKESYFAITFANSSESHSRPTRRGDNDDSVESADDNSWGRPPRSTSTHSQRQVCQRTIDDCISVDTLSGPQQGHRSDLLAVSTAINDDQGACVNPALLRNKPKGSWKSKK